ncbi:MAG: DUF1492 domain-containing protein [Clostridia bacterium]|nr:DUF1492 domain-containing protein [Clostridia bacterium]
MNYAEFKRRLENLYIDLRCSNVELISLLFRYNTTVREREDIIRQLYDYQYLNARTGNLESLGRSADRHSPEAEIRRLEKYITGFDEFVRKQELEIDTMIENNKIANKFLNLILSMDTDFSNILYAKYVKKMPDKDIIYMLYISRSTYYRRLGKARTILLNMYNSDEA